MLTSRALRTAVAQVRSGLQVAALLRQPVTSAAEYEDGLRQRLARREEHFLSLVERLVFAYLGSPYRPLFEVAGYDLPKVRQLVAARGLDGALDQLREDGVYVRIREFKGGEPTVRRGRTFHFQERDFANPTVRALYQVRSSGSRSRGTETPISTDDILYHARCLKWLLEGYGLAGRDVLMLLVPGMGVNYTMLFALAGHLPLRFFSVVEPFGQGNLLLLRTARLASRVSLPSLEFLPLPRVAEVARYISRVTTHRGLLVFSGVPLAQHLVMAAREAGIDLGDVAFMLGGLLTAAKRRQLEEGGRRIVSLFAFSELGVSGWGCPAPQEPGDVHVMTDMVAVRQYERIVDEAGTTVPAYLYTTLLAHAPHVMVNMECGDYGALEERACGCFFDRAGLRLHMHTIHSFEKLKAEGMTFIGPSLVELIEEVLPREFGGDERHYQLVEADDRDGQTRLYLLASPRLGPLDEEALRRTVLREIGGRHIKGAYGRRVQQAYERAGTIRVLRRDPLPTSGGKILHMHQYRGPGPLDLEERDGSGQSP